VSVGSLWRYWRRLRRLHAIHDGACQIFGTTLGPEANEAHKNHFHLDIKERRHPLCDFTPEQFKAREEDKTTTEVSPSSSKNNSAASQDTKPNWPSRVR
jgi:Extensin-like protein C-terminus